MNASLHPLTKGRITFVRTDPCYGVVVKCGRIVYSFASSNIRLFPFLERPLWHELRSLDLA